jgi:antitoxin component of RelBE/YafQ-DinJ toxin-antitoxin module
LLPNAETRRAIEETDRGENVVRFTNLEELFEDLGI